MKFKVIGSGGCVCTPKPLCRCPVCVTAREKGFPYARCSCSLYLEDAALIVDTPEDIAAAINNAGIEAVDAVMYSHWDPDHTLGMRVMEQLRLEWLDFFEDKRPENPIAVYAAPEVMSDLNKIRNKFGAFLDYYEKMGLITRHVLDGNVELDGIRITLIPVPKNKSVTVFVFEQDGKKLVYAPCDCKPFPEDDIIRFADVLLIGNTYIGNTLKGGREIYDGHLLRKELHSFEDVLAIKERLDIKEVIFTHLEEDWGKTYDDYARLEVPGVRFAYDGMIISL